jgi:hypothetical protein
MARQRFTDEDGSFWGIIRGHFGHKECLEGVRQMPYTVEER